MSRADKGDALLKSDTGVQVEREGDAALGDDAKLLGDAKAERDDMPGDDEAASDPRPAAADGSDGGRVEIDFGTMLHFLKMANPGRESLAHCFFMEASPEGKCENPNCWFFHRGHDCESYVRSGPTACEDASLCGLLHRDFRRDYHRGKAPLPSEKKT